MFVTAAGPRLCTGLDHSARLQVVVRHRRGRTRPSTPANRDPETPGVCPAASRGPPAPPRSLPRTRGCCSGAGAYPSSPVTSRGTWAPVLRCTGAFCPGSRLRPGEQQCEHRAACRRPSGARSVPSCGHPLHPKCRPPHLSVSRKPAPARSPKRPKHINRRAPHNSPPLFSLRSRCNRACPPPDLADGPMATAAGQVPAEQAQGSTPCEHQQPGPSARSPGGRHLGSSVGNQAWAAGACPATPWPDGHAEGRPQPRSHAHEAHSGVSPHVPAPCRERRQGRECPAGRGSRPPWDPRLHWLRPKSSDQFTV